MNRSLTTLIPTLSLSTLLFAACGDAPAMQKPREPDLSPPPAGKVALVVPRSATPLKGNVRAAVLWSSYDLSDIFSGGKIKNVAVSSDVAVSNDLPSRVLLDIEEIKKGPTSTPDMPFIIFGTPIVYEDSNKNGKLDLATKDDAAPIDRLLGTSDHMVYILAVDEESEAAGEGAAPSLHLARVPATSAVPPVCDEPMPGSEELPLATVIQVALDANATYELPLCDEATLDTEAACDLESGNVTCNADGSGFVTSSIQDEGTACAHRVYCSSRECPAPSERPAYCPAK